MNDELAAFACANDSAAAARGLLLSGDIRGQKTTPFGPVREPNGVAATGTGASTIIPVSTAAKDYAPPLGV